MQIRRLCKACACISLLGASQLPAWGLTPHPTVLAPEPGGLLLLGTGLLGAAAIAFRVRRGNV